TGIVTQEPLLFGDTVRANISCGRSGIPDSDLTEAARAANALEFIERLPEGFDTRVGERGATLSGGQKQRIAIARAILRDPDLLVFDEATSSLDAESEKLVQEAVEALIRDRTVLVIAHRLSTVVSADMIVVLDGGRVTASGPHARLLEESPLYRRLYEQQLCPPLGNDGSGPGLG
ncbi:ATP-binding cassette domain-containing protein, partial [Candidatus Fermentibacterales bacterium]|nr:ATP-binding cassette domain-containing protein [Candidatus Fermentibacterales bacterium]